MNESGSAAHRILVAGIGNIFEGDDAFGVEVVKQLAQQPRPDQVHIEDFGIRSYDLAFALTAGYDVAILVDATRRGHLPGTLYLLELDLEELKSLDPGTVDPHRLNPLRVLQMANALGGVSGKLYLVGCEPAILANENADLGLSDAVQEAIPQALEMIEALVRDALGLQTKRLAGLVPS